MRYEWDPSKDRINQSKHGILFEAAAAIFTDRNCVIIADRIDEQTGEQRWHAVGRIAGHSGPLLVVVHVYREDLHGEEIIRIISARIAGGRDRSRYPSLH